jgi:hypothetical protein
MITTIIFNQVKQILANNNININDIELNFFNKTIIINYSESNIKIKYYKYNNDEIISSKKWLNYLTTKIELWIISLGNKIIKLTNKFKIKPPITNCKKWIVYLKSNCYINQIDTSDIYINHIYNIIHAFSCYATCYTINQLKLSPYICKIYEDKVENINPFSINNIYKYNKDTESKQTTQTTESNSF